MLALERRAESVVATQSSVIKVESSHSNLDPENLPEPLFALTALSSPASSLSLPFLPPPSTLPSLVVSPVPPVHFSPPVPLLHSPPWIGLSSGRSRSQDLDPPTPLFALLGPSPQWIWIRRQGEWGHEIVREIVRQALEALDVVHHLGISHRDIKPENIMLQREVGSGKLGGKDEGGKDEGGKDEGAYQNQRINKSNVSKRERKKRGESEPEGKMDWGNSSSSSFVLRIIDFGSAWDPDVVQLSGVLQSAVLGADEDASEEELLKMHAHFRDCENESSMTWEYAPPEVVLGHLWQSKTHQSTVASTAPAVDVWALGVSWLEMVLGTSDVFEVPDVIKSRLASQAAAQKLSEQEIQAALYLRGLMQWCIHPPLFSAYESGRNMGVDSRRKKTRERRGENEMKREPNVTLEEGRAAEEGRPERRHGTGRIKDVARRGVWRGEQEWRGEWERADERRGEEEKNSEGHPKDGRIDEEREDVSEGQEREGGVEIKKNDKGKDVRKESKKSPVHQRRDGFSPDLQDPKLASGPSKPPAPWVCMEQHLLDLAKRRDPAGVGLEGVMALRLLRAMLAFHPRQRPTARQALSHAFFTVPKEKWPTSMCGSMQMGSNGWC